MSILQSRSAHIGFVKDRLPYLSFSDCCGVGCSLEQPVLICSSLLRDFSGRERSEVLKQKER